MNEQPKPYIPSEEEIGKAKETMTYKQQELSENRQEIFESKNWQDVFKEKYEPSRYAELRDLQNKWSFSAKTEDEKREIEKEYDKIKAEETAAQEEYWTRYHVGTEKIKSLIGGDFDALPRGYDREGWGNRHVDVDGYRISYRWSKWKGDSPLEITSVELIDSTK